MKKIKLSVQTTSIKVDSNPKEIEHLVSARCEGKEVAFNMQSLVVASLQLPKELGMVMYQNPNKLTVKVYFLKRAKDYNLKLRADELSNSNSLDSSMRKLTRFIRSIEADIEKEIANTTIENKELEFGGND